MKRRGGPWVTTKEKGHVSTIKLGYFKGSVIDGTKGGKTCQDPSRECTKSDSDKHKKKRLGRERRESVATGRCGDLDAGGPY